MEKADIAILGGGVVGNATALEASVVFPNRRIIVYEKNSTVGLEASGRNSGVLHTGFHHPAGSLKEKLANQGSKIVRKYVQIRKVPILQCGMLVVVPTFSSIGSAFSNLGILKSLCLNGKRQNVNFIVLGKKGVKKLEPNVEALAGLFLPDVAVIDFVAYVKALFYDAKSRGVEFFFDTKVEQVVPDGDEFVINDKFRAKAVVNCAGIYADAIASLCGLKYQQYPVRGEYYQIIGPKKKIVSRLVNPAVPPGNSSKGIHFSPRTDGKMFLGPSYKILGDKENYEGDKTPPEIFVKSVRSFVPDIGVDDLRWASSGIRAKLSTDSDPDFIIRLDMTRPALVNNIGIGSPGLSASMAIAEMNCRLLKESI
ncbi:MAG: FAD-dependent oxidoreductase [Patescibacteria group bacterium]